MSLSNSEHMAALALLRLAGSPLTLPGLILDSHKQSWADLDWTGLGWTGLDWAVLGWAEGTSSTKTSSSYHFSSHFQPERPGLTFPVKVHSASR